MATIIEQEPLYPQLPVGQDVIFTVSNASIVSTETKVKFIARVYISELPITIATSTPIGTFKTTANNAGVGMFDFRPVIENFVKADNLAGLLSEYKATPTTADSPHSIHLIDKYSTNTNIVRYLKIEFGIEYLGATDCAGDQDDDIVREDCGEEVESTEYTLMNGYLKYTDRLDIFNAEFGYNLGDFNLSSITDNFLTNAPKTQYANINDYGTLSFLAPNDNVTKIRLSYTDAAGGSLGNEFVDKVIANGVTSWDTKAENQLLHFGCFPANLQADGTTMFAGLVAAGTIQGGSISVQAFDNGTNKISVNYTINLNCPEQKGYEPIRLTWLNQWGVWDYYTFTKKSTRTISTKGSTYEQLAGSWNESTYRVDSFRGGKKTFRVNATEKIKMNTDFVSEADSEWFEELINSPEVYILEGFQTDGTFAALNTYVTPARLTTSSFVRKTVANDKLMQYTFEVEKSKTLRTQSV
jgi:hypothetical protein